LENHHHLGLVTPYAQHRHRLQQRRQSLEGDVGAGHRQDPPRHLGHRGCRLVEIRIDADVDHPDPLRRQPDAGDDVLPGSAGNGDHGRQSLRHAALHVVEAVPAMYRELALESPGLGQFQLAVDLDGMVDAGQHRQAHARQRQHAIAEALVVVDDVKIAGAISKEPGNPETERERLGEAGGAHDAELQRVDPIAVLPEARETEGILVAEQVKAGNPDQLDTGVELRVGLAGEDRDRMAEASQGAAQLAHVNALPPGVRVAAVGQDRDPQGSF